MTILHREAQPSEWMPPYKSLKGVVVESWCCVDCGVNTAPGCSTRAEVEAAYNSADYDAHNLGTMRICTDTELYTVRDSVWKKAGMEGWGGCLCIGCLERRIGRRLKPKDFPADAFNFPALPCTERLRDRRGY
jgi:hypothetical protein